MAVAQGALAAGLVLLSYPLHPPDKPDKLRTAHFGHIDVPCLFISGTRDPFATPAELELHANQIPAPVTLRFIDGARHDPSTIAARAAIIDHIIDWLAELQS